MVNNGLLIYYFNNQFFDSGQGLAPAYCGDDFQTAPGINDSSLFSNRQLAGR